MDDYSVQHLYISHLEGDRYQRLSRREAGSGVESFLSASFQLTIVSGCGRSFSHIACHQPWGALPFSSLSQ